VDRIIDSYPPKEQNQIRAMLSESLRAVITQRLIPHTNQQEMVLALEVLIGSTQMGNLIRDSKTFQIPSMMQTGKKLGMQLMDESLLGLCQSGQISGEDAIANAANPDKLKTQIKS
jgi:twitching motility protein PilT